MIWYPTFETRRITVSCLLCLFGSLLFGQSPLTSGFFNYHLTDRYEIKSNELTTEFYSGIKPFRRDAVARFAKNLTPKSNQDNFNKNYLITDNIPFSEGPLDTKREFRKIYPQENSFFLVNEDRFKAVLNPVIGFSGAIVANDTSRLYQNSRGFDGNAPIQRKYSALHHLSLNVGKNLTLGIWENVIFDRQDSLENDRFEVDYFNPLIFYRAVEHGLNSSDNVLLGMDWKWNFLSRFSFYGQFVLDEFLRMDSLMLLVHGLISGVIKLDLNILTWEESITKMHN